MSTWINLPLEKVNQQFLVDLKKRFAAGSRVELRVVDPSEITSLSEDTFWQIIGQLSWSAEDVAQVLQPAITALAARSVAEIFLFEDRLAEKLQALDTPAHALAVYGSEDAISVDGFLYIRAGVVAEGRTFYEKILHDPIALTDDLDFEPLLSLAAKSYELKTGKVFDYFSHTSYETFSNNKAWNQ